MELSLQAYQASRQLLIARERQLSHHHNELREYSSFNFSTSNTLNLSLINPYVAYTTKEQHAVDLIKALERKEVDSLWSKSSASSKVQGVESTVWLGMPFTSSKSIMENSDLFRLIRSFPKGSLLHCHLDAM